MKLETAALSELMLDLAASLYGEKLFKRRQLMDATEAEVRRLGLWTTEDDILSGSVGIKSRGLAAIDYRFSDLARVESLMSEGRDSWRVAAMELVRIREKSGAGSTTASRPENPVTHKSETLSVIRPQSKRLVYDLVTQAGVDTSDWANFKGDHPASNPKYCYDWAFWDDTKRVVVLCLWYSQMDEHGGVAFQELNYREVARKADGVRVARAQRMDHGLSLAFKRNLPVRVIVIDGDRRGEADAEFSKVALRMLDPMPWSVVSYDSDSGECRVERGTRAVQVRSFLLTWGNFEETPDSEMLEVTEALKTAATSQTQWSSGNRRDMNVGERVFLLRQGRDYPGIVGQGIIAEAPKPGKHWDPERRKAGVEAWYIKVNWHEMLSKEAGLSRQTLVDAGFSESLLNAQSSGVMIPDADLAKLDQLWTKHFQLSPGDIGAKALEAPAKTENRRLARIAYNSAGWQRPTGDAGELESGETYNAKNKFGHEDWLFRAEWVIDGWRYAFVQGLSNHYRTKYRGQPLDVTLYTLQPDKRRRLVATIYGLESLSDEQAKDALAAFKARGWLRTMQAEVKAIGGNADALGDPKWAEHILNVRYRLDNVDAYPPDTFLSDDDWIHDRHRYMLYRLEDTDRERIEHGRPGRSGSQQPPEVRRLFRRGTKPVEYTPEHDRMQAKLMAELQTEYGRTCVCREEDFVDVRVETDKELIYFEIKTDLDPRAVIRQALGQILEYAYHPARTGRRPDRLVVVGRTALGPQDEFYMKSLCERFSLPLSYRVISL